MLYTNSTVSCIHVNTTECRYITCTLVATSVILRSLECTVCSNATIILINSLNFSPMLQLTSMMVDGVKISFPVAWAGGWANLFGSSDLLRRWEALMSPTYSSPATNPRPSRFFSPLPLLYYLSVSIKKRKEKKNKRPYIVPA